ncbi:hypothetical protein UABAM_03191 [Candidatus Uabimicrobium amorphum]|uniref:Uncharacterized protein n=1 Tax=Uabimicrobium amorphum TaxID=2596890 RepID=A0A5S9IPL1_UABAM|nr:hypothetical protein UABAM_03191 [Candidatus Uabimicrobium amorphum]
MKSMKSCLIKLIVCLLALAYCFYASPNQITFDIVAISILSCRYFAVLCIEFLYSRLDKINYAV